MWHTERIVSCSLLYLPSFSINWYRHIMLSTQFSKYLTNSFQSLSLQRPALFWKCHVQTWTQYSTGTPTSPIHDLKIPLTPLRMKSASFSARIPPNLYQFYCFLKSSVMITGITSDAVDKATLTLTCKWIFLRSKS